MFPDREEIRWKFQTIIEMANTASKLHEDSRKEMESKGIFLVHEVEKLRNNLLAGIGFVLGLIVSLMAVGVIGKDYTWSILIGVVIGIGVYIGFNILAWREYVKIEQILDELQTSEIMADDLKSSILRISIDENITKDHVMLLIDFIEVLLQAIAYKIDFLSQKIYKTEVDKTKYSNTYNIAKLKLLEFKTLNLDKHFTIIEYFVNDFESKH